MKPKDNPNSALILCAGILLLALFPKLTEAAPARCFLHGIITSKLDAKAKSAFSDQLRMHFDVSKPTDQGRCEKLMESYCYHHIYKKDYDPTALKGSFKPRTDKEEEIIYKFSPKCKLDSDE